MDYYKTLGVSKEADADEIRKAYRRLARKHHPDLNPGDKAAEDRFKTVQEAYDILSEPKKKQMYDQYGFYSENGMPQSGGPGARRAEGPEHGLRRVRFFGRVSRRPAADVAPATDSSSNFQDIFSQWFGGGKAGRCQHRSSGKGRGSRIRAEHRFLAGD